MSISKLAQAEVQHDREIEKLKAENKLLKQKYNAVNSELKQTVKNSDILTKLQQQVSKDNLKILKPTGQSTAILVLSDFHLEETVDPKTISGLNEYNLTIAEDRVKKCFERAHMLIEVSRGLTKIDSLVVAILGDQISGHIHEELVEGNALSPLEATKFSMELLVQGLRFLKREGKYKEIIVPTAFGNHGRSTIKKRCSTGFKHSFEWFSYIMMQQIMAQDAGISFKIENSYFNYLDIQGHKCRFSHGDYVKYQGGVGGITIPVNKAIAQWNKSRYAQYDYFGHYHQSINMNNWTCNGSLIGYNAYALSIKAEYEVPSQTLSIMNKERGKILTDRIFTD